MSAECALIGMILRDPDNLGRALGKSLSPSDFGDEELSTIFAAMVQAEATRRPYDLPNLGIELLGLRVRLVDLFEAAPITGDPFYFTDEILAAAWARRSALRLAEVSARLYSRQAFANIDWLRDELVRVTDELAAGPEFGRGTAQDPVATTSAALLELEQMAISQRDGKRIGVATGLKAVDRHILNMRPGWLYVIGARPGVGKTTLALQAALNAAMDKVGVLYITMEMPASDLMMKAASCVGRVPLKKMLNGDMNDDEMDRFTGAVTQISNTDLFIDDGTRGFIDRIELSAGRASRQGLLGLLVIDYIQQCRILNTKHRTRSDEVAEISWRLKCLAMRLGVPVLALAQINRKASENGGSPEVWHIKDSGAIEQDADVIMLLHATEEETWLKISKQRRGETGQVQLEADLACSRFHEIAKYQNGTPSS